MPLGEKEWKEHAELIGRVTLAWNQNVHQLLKVFSHLTGLGSPLAETIFFSHQSDRGQRQLLKRVAVAVELPEEHRVSLGKLLKRLDEEAIGRNLAAHTIFSVTLFDQNTNTWGPKVVPALWSQDSRLQKDFQDQFQLAEITLVAIYKGLEDWLLHTPYPTRPWGTPAILGARPMFEPDLDALSDDPEDWPI